MKNQNLKLKEVCCIIEGQEGVFVTRRYFVSFVTYNSKIGVRIEMQRDGKTAAGVFHKNNISY